MGEARWQQHYRSGPGGEHEKRAWVLRRAQFHPLADRLHHRPCRRGDRQSAAEPLSGIFRRTKYDKVCSDLMCYGHWSLA
jgi:hypothetical protein